MGHFLVFLGSTLVTLSSIFDMISFFEQENSPYFLFSNVLVSVWVGFFNCFEINGIYFLRQQCSNDAIVSWLRRGLYGLQMQLEPAKFL